MKAKPTTTTTYTELPALLGGRPAGTVIKIEGYVGTDMVTKDLTVRTLGPDDYKRLQRESLTILEGSTTPSIPGFETKTLEEAHEAMKVSVRKSLEGGAFPGRADIYETAPEGGYARKPGTDDAVYLLRTQEMTSSVAEAPSFRFDLPRAKSAIAKALRLPTDSYVHVLKLSPGRFVRVSIV